MESYISHTSLLQLSSALARLLEIPFVESVMSVAQECGLSETEAPLKNLQCMIEGTIRALQRENYVVEGLFRRSGNASTVSRMCTRLQAHVHSTQSSDAAALDALVAELSNIIAEEAGSVHDVVSCLKRLLRGNHDSHGHSSSSSSSSTSLVYSMVPYTALDLLRQACDLKDSSSRLEAFRIIFALFNPRRRHALMDIFKIMATAVHNGEVTRMNNESLTTSFALSLIVWPTDPEEDSLDLSTQASTVIRTLLEVGPQLDGAPTSLSSIPVDNGDIHEPEPICQGLQKLEPSKVLGELAEQWRIKYNELQDKDGRENARIKLMATLEGLLQTTRNATDDDAEADRIRCEIQLLREAQPRRGWMTPRRLASTPKKLVKGLKRRFRRNTAGDLCDAIEGADEQNHDHDDDSDGNGDGDEHDGGMAALMMDAGMTSTMTMSTSDDTLSSGRASLVSDENVSTVFNVPASPCVGAIKAAAQTAASGFATPAARHDDSVEPRRPLQEAQLQQAAADVDFQSPSRFHIMRSAYV